MHPRARTRYAVGMRCAGVLGWRVVVVAAAWGALGGCGDEGASGAPDAATASDAGESGDSGSGSDAGATDAGFGRVMVGGDRPARVVVPSSYDGVTPLPLIVLLHGYGIDGFTQDVYWGLSRRVDTDGFFLVAPDGTVDAEGRRFWNASPACCDFGHVGVDDVAYIRGLVAEMKSRFAIDPARVYATGHSNGGFMSHRLACDAADDFVAIASIAGATSRDAADCTPSQPVSVLEMHGDLDEDVIYGGVTGAYPSAPVAIDRWATLDACDPSAGPITTDPPIDFDTAVAGAETTIRRWTTGCAHTTESTLWTIAGVGHVPSLQRTFAQTLVAWLLAHPRR